MRVLKQRDNDVSLMDNLRLFKRRCSLSREFIRVVRSNISQNNTLGSDNSPSSVVTQRCVPFVSYYTDCTDANRCFGCTQCQCNRYSEWECRNVNDCDDNLEPIGDKNLENALDELQRVISNNQGSVSYAKNEQSLELPRPSDSMKKKVEVLDSSDNEDINTDAAEDRKKRSPASATERTTPKTNGTIIFHNVVDEFNENTLKTLNYSGTISMAKVKGSSKANNTKSNSSDLTALHIEGCVPSQSDPNHITCNKVEAASHDTELDKMSHKKLQDILHNQTQVKKDKDISKLLVHELKKGSEVVGDPKAPKVTNVTFTAENDNLTAVAIIAGNLLNKLWTMEKESQHDSKEVGAFKHEKIVELLELFKEPLTIKQGKFLKTALDTLVQAVDKNKDLDSVSICENVEEAKKKITSKETKDNINKDAIEKEAKNKALDKVTNVVGLIKKMENVKRRLDNFKKEDDELNLFGDMLHKISKLLITDKNKLISPLTKLNSQQVFKKSGGEIIDKIKDFIGIDIDTSNLTAKDKLVFDYLSKIEENPEKILGIKNLQPNKQKIQGDSVDNLLELIKVKSFADLLVLLNNDKPKEKSTTTTPKPNKREGQKLANAKDKLKNHLKSILQDLTQLKSENGGPLAIVDINTLLPCVSNILNDDKINNNNKNKNVDSIEKLRQLFNSIKEEAENPSNRRNFNKQSKDRPQSAKVLERVVKSLNDLSKKNTRRMNNVNEQKITFREAIKGLEETKSQITSEAIALVPPADQLQLYRTLHMNVKRYINIIKNLIASIDTNREIRDNNKKISNLVDNTINDIEYTVNLANKLKNNRIKNYTLLNSEPQDGSQEMKINNKYSESNMNFAPKQTSAKSNKISRDLIMTQLMRNRAERFIKNYLSNGFGDRHAQQYLIAKRILSSLDHGDLTLANELYMIFSLPDTHHNINPGNLQLTRGLFHK